MNTPRTKAPRRYGSHPVKQYKQPDGRFRQGLHNEAIIMLVGRIVTAMPLIEREMISVFEELLGGAAPAQTVFYSIINNQTRIDVMRSLLESSAINVDKDQWFDWVLDEYKAVGKARNDYAHGLWWTHDSGRVFVEEDPLSPVGSLSWREVPGREVNDAYNRLIKLHDSLREHNMERFKARAAAIIAQRASPKEGGEEDTGAGDKGNG